jgi:hypothetical protein
VLPTYLTYHYLLALLKRARREAVRSAQRPLAPHRALLNTRVTGTPFRRSATVEPAVGERRVTNRAARMMPSGGGRVCKRLAPYPSFPRREGLAAPLPVSALPICHGVRSTTPPASSISNLRLLIDVILLFFLCPQRLGHSRNPFPLSALPRAARLLTTRVLAKPRVRPHRPHHWLAAGLAGPANAAATRHGFRRVAAPWAEISIVVGVFPIGSRCVFPY